MKLKFQVMGTLVSSNGNCGFKRWKPFETPSDKSEQSIYQAITEEVSAINT